MAKHFSDFNTKSALDTVKRSISKDPTRYFMERAYVAPGKIDDESAPEYWTLAATDGHIMSVVELPDSMMRSLYVGDPREGYVDIDPKASRIIPNQQDAQFPQWRRVIPSMREGASLLPIPAMSDISEQVSVAVPLWSAYTGIALNYDLASIIPRGGSWQANAESSPKKAVQIDYQGQLWRMIVVIMPVWGDGAHSEGAEAHATVAVHRLASEMATMHANKA